MIHLFNNVSLEDIKYINYKTPNFEIVVADYDESKYVGTTGYTSMEEMDLVNWIDNIGDTRVILYCDITNMSKILATFYKSTLNIDQDAYEELIHTYDYKLKTFEFESWNEDFLDTCINAFADADTLTISTDISQSYEILLANAFVDADSVKDKLNPLLSKFILRQHQNIVNEAKNIVDKNITSLNIQKLIGNSTDTVVPVSNISSLDASLLDTDLSSAGSNLSKVTKLADDVFSASEPEITVLPSLEWNYIDEVVDGDLIDASYQNVINEISNSEVRIPYLPEDLEVSINSQFIEYARNLTNEELAKYTIK